MFVEFHDAEKGNTFCAVHRNIDYEYQAEMIVQESCKDDPQIVLWALFTDDGVHLRTWERTSSSFDEITLSQPLTPDPRSMRKK